LAFEEFTQADTSDARRFSGLGLGLSFVRGVAIAHGGAVACASVAPAGMRVSISLPL
jgi:two-component system sensor histidine kinase AdeS